MPSTYTDNLGIEKIANGEQSGTWGDTTNLNFDILDQAINGIATVTLASAGSSGSPNTLAITDGALSNGRAKFIEFTDGGDLGATAYVQLTPNNAEKIVFIRNSLSGSRSVILFQGTYDSGRDLEIAAGVDMIVKFEGGGSVSTVENVSQNLRVEALQVNGNITVTGTVDGRDIATDGSKLDGIEALADVTDTANVTAAGALMDNELTNIAAVKALNQGVATTNSPSFAGLTVDTDTLYVDGPNDRVGIGTTSPDADLTIVRQTAGLLDPLLTLESARPTMHLRDQGNVGQNSSGAVVFVDENDDINGMMQMNRGVNTDGRLSLDALYGDIELRTGTGGTATTRLTVEDTGDVVVAGALSKGSGSFRIDHPLKPDTHHLVHSFIEGPQADNIYRGRVQLVDGRAEINLDESSRMTEGTFVLLNGNVQCFTSNESGWSAVRGSVSGNTLSIEAQDEACTDFVSWMVVGERIDDHIVASSLTDDSGKIITEPVKSEATLRREASAQDPRPETVD